MNKETANKTIGLKKDNGKPQWHLMPWKQLAAVVDILTFGAAKYAPNNWKFVPNAEERYEDALYRHLTAWSSGEKKDPESGKSHLAHVVCNALFLMFFEDKESHSK